MLLTHKADRKGKLLSFLRRELKLSSGLIGHLKYENCFFVDGKPAYTDLPVLPGQTITVKIEESRPAEFTPEYTEISIVYEDEYLLAVDKPAGVIVHPTFYRTSGTLLTQVLGYYEKTGQDCGIHFVNRLDRDTCGVVLLAKNAYIHALLYDAQLAGDFDKTYHAVCVGVPEKAEGEIDLPIGRVDGGSLLRKIDEQGQSALTRYRLLESRDGLSLMELMPVTGRTHQLRLHCLSLGIPILGDPQYNTEQSKALSARYGLTVQQLCAEKLCLHHPLSGELLTLKAKHTIFLPERLQSAQNDV